MLSSVVLVSLNGAREKGRIASVQTFEGNLYQAWGADAVALFDFNTATTTPVAMGVTLTNTASYSATLACSSAQIRDVSSISTTGGNIGSLGMVLYSNASTACNRNPYDYTIAKFDVNNGSISFWVYPTSIADNDLIGFVGSRWIQFSSSGQIRLGNNVAFGDSIVIASTKSLPLNQWSHVLISWSNSASEKWVIYIDGKKDAYSNSPMLTWTGSAPLYIGGFGSIGLRGYLDRFAIYNKSIQSP
ncbi:MAG: Concanavalin A-like lectin/glucanase superfamily [Candidatus Parcubacteria bacterium]